jgi:isoaspartyl peptidase/L-asparaginase-like protein (Ntn-hydrolase superfamily)
MHPIMLSTWSFGPIGNEPAMAAMRAGASSLDAVEIAATAIEDDPKINSVGVGGLPDASGRVSLDGCVMTSPSRCGSVAFLRHYPNPVSLARRVMEKTIHVMLVGDGAEEFAAREGFSLRELLTDYGRAEWDKWRGNPRNIEREQYKGWIPPLNVEEKAKGGGSIGGGGAGGPRRDLYRDAGWPHDTVSILAVDQQGKLAGACSTSGMAFKVPGRVGDSPIIGHGLYVDDQVGGAAATGNGELVMGTCASFLAVEQMRRGASPLEAAREALRRIMDRFEMHPDHQVAIIVMGVARSGDGEAPWASAAIRPGFHHTISDARGTRVEPPLHVLIP